MEEINLSDINLLDIGNEIQITGVIWTGKGMAFATQFPHKSEDLSNLKKLNMSLEDWLAFLRQTDILETEIFSTDPSGKLVKSIVRKTARQIDSQVQWTVFRRDNYTCRYCGRTGIPLTVDHIDLWELGGATVPENLVAACKNCNKDRGNTPYPDWLASHTYIKRSNNLPREVQELNVALVAKLPELEAMRVKNVRSR